MLPFRQLILLHGYSLTFVWVLSVQCGLPVPADPLLLLMGALAADHRYSFVTLVLVATSASVIGDLIWYELGRHRGRAVLGLICRLAIEPDTCVRKTEGSFSRRGAATLLIAKFIPGISLVATPMAGITGMPLWRFVVFDAAGSALWVSTYLLAGFIFHKQVDALVKLLGQLGHAAAILIGGLLALYLGLKYFQRWRFLRRLRTNRVTPEILHKMRERGETPMVIDLRHPAEIERDGVKLAGALMILPDELRSRAAEIPRDREIILYCSCPNQATSASLALQLRKLGVRHVRPLEGGLDAWRALAFPVEAVSAELVPNQHSSDSDALDLKPR